MSTPKQALASAIRAEAKRHEGVKQHLAKLGRLVERVSDPQLRTSLQRTVASLRGEWGPCGAGGWSALSPHNCNWQHPQVGIMRSMQGCPPLLHLLLGSTPQLGVAPLPFWPLLCLDLPARVLEPCWVWVLGWDGGEVMGAGPCWGWCCQGSAPSWGGAGLGRAAGARLSRAMGVCAVLGWERGYAMLGGWDSLGNASRKGQRQPMPGHSCQPRGPLLLGLGYRGGGVGRAQQLHAGWGGTSVLCRPRLPAGDT